MFVLTVQFIAYIKKIIHLHILNVLTISIIVMNMTKHQGRSERSKFKGVCMVRNADFIIKIYRM